MKSLKYILFLLALNFVYGQDLRKPDLSDEKYGQHDLNTFDFWKAESSTSTPLVIYIHGGGFTSGDKEKVPNKMVKSLLEKGISVMSINYRLTPEVVFPQHYLDCSRAIQYARYNAAELNINPALIGATGSSAGACSALWIGFHDEMADTQNEDPVLRMSSRLSCIGITSGQTTLDPDVIKELVGELALKHSFMKGSFFGLSSEEMKTSKAQELIEQASPVTYLTKDDPPVYAFYSVYETPKNVSEAIHHINFGIYLKEKMDALGIECTVRNPEEVKSSTNESVEFFVKHLKTN